ncbi:serpin family protein [Candidatus Woesearchaeota archaeon]|nr:serpin family protein [Candidatus Woesearchaeota archaeon]
MKAKKIFGTIFILSILFLGLFLTACQTGPSVPLADDSGATSEGVSAVVKANNQFALELYSKLNEDEDGNIFFSPYSISTALAMTYEGANGQTAEEMQEVFHFPEEADVRRPAYAKVYNDLNKKDKKYKLHTANALWAEQTYHFLPEYMSNVEQYYGSGVTNLDFIGASEESRQIINKWVEDMTNHKIKDIIPAGAINPMTRLVLTNAIYFKGTWVKEFEKKDTHDAPFRVSPDKTVTVDMMVRDDKDAKFNYYENEDLQVLEMLYKGEDLSMLVLLPKDEDLIKLEESLTIEKLNEWKNGLMERQMDVYLPKFTFETKYFMAETLSEMGMPLAFTPFEADFSGMTGSRGLFISQVIHQAFVDVNEEGTEAAAATVVIMELSAGPMNNFRADHPFIFIIQERETGNILFMGRVVDPTAE